VWPERRAAGFFADGTTGVAGLDFASQIIKIHAHVTGGKPVIVEDPPLCS